MGLIPLFAVEVGCPTSRAKLQKFAVHSSGLSQKILDILAVCLLDVILCWLLFTRFFHAVDSCANIVSLFALSLRFWNPPLCSVHSAVHTGGQLHAKSEELPWGHAEEIAPFCRTNAWEPWEPEANQCRYSLEFLCFNLLKGILRSLKSRCSMLYPMTDLAGAARKMVCHGSHQEIPPIYVSIFLPAPWIRHG